MKLLGRVGALSCVRAACMNMGVGGVECLETSFFPPALTCMDGAVFLYNIFSLGELVPSLGCQLGTVRKRNGTHNVHQCLLESNVFHFILKTLGLWLEGGALKR